MERHVLLALRFLALGVVFVLLAGAEPVYAFNQDWGGLEDDWSMPTYTSGGPNSPTPSTCYAKAADNQKCRDCAATYYDNGIAKPYKVCGWFAQNAGCDCKNKNTANCVGVGSCTYHG